ncbi:MAG: YlcI/YnfO family protein [Pseudomonadota bacterium]
MAKEKIINIRVESDLKKRAKKLAERDGRSLSNWIVRLIQKEIKKEFGDKKDKKSKSD